MDNTTASFRQAALGGFTGIVDPTALKLRDAIVGAVSGSRIDAVDSIEQQRKSFLSNHNSLVDGSIGEGGLYDKGLTIAQACKVSKSPKFAIFLYYVVKELKPLTILELGTNLGLSSAYLAAAANANGKGDTITMEASPYRQRVAKSAHERLGLKNISYVQGLFSDTLKGVLQQSKPIDFSFIDGHHQYEPTKIYFDQIYEASTEVSVHFFDDIRWSEGMTKAWDEIKTDPRVKLAIDIGHFGIVLCSKSEQVNTPTVIRLSLEPQKSFKSRIKAALKKILG